MPRPHKESHLIERIGWLRAAVLGANEGIISTASLFLGVAAAAAAKSDVLLAAEGCSEKNSTGHVVKAEDRIGRRHLNIEALGGMETCNE
jgi:VIT1/CCC1 family predicted Fe2+/Mn2+ transporter